MRRHPKETEDQIEEMARALAPRISKLVAEEATERGLPKMGFIFWSFAFGSDYFTVSGNVDRSTVLRALRAYVEKLEATN